MLQRELVEMRTLPAAQTQRKPKFDGEPKKPPVYVSIHAVSFLQSKNVQPPDERKMQRISSPSAEAATRCSPRSC